MNNAGTLFLLILGLLLLVLVLTQRGRDAFDVFVGRKVVAR